jgi:E3 ubiquitin-protein transferase RMND5
MEGPLKELAKLEKLTSKSLKGKAASVDDSLVSLLQSLRDAKDRLEVGVETEETIIQLAQTVDGIKKDVDDRQKEVYSSLSRLGKALDKVGNTTNVLVMQR